MQGRRLSIDRRPIVADGGDGGARFRNWLKEQSKLVEARQADKKEKEETGGGSRRGSFTSLSPVKGRRGSLLNGVENATGSNRAESRMSVAGSSRRGSIAASSHPEDVDLGWLAWKESRKNESRRASVVSISGEDHGLKSIGKWTKAVEAVTAAREGSREEEKKQGYHHLKLTLLSQLLVRI